MPSPMARPALTHRRRLTWAQPSVPAPLRLRRVRALVAASIGVLLVGAIWLGRTWPELTPTHVLDALRSLGDLGAIGWAAVAALQVFVAVSGILPASVVGLTAGAVYGVTAGFLLSAVTLMLGAVIAFLLGRSLLRPWLQRLLQRRPRLGNLDRLAARRGWVLIALLRVSPVMPFALTSYALGLSAISLRDYALGTLASLPALLGYVCLGALGRAGLAAGVEGASMLRWALVALGSAGGAALALQIGRIIALALRTPAGLDPEVLRPD
jgi:uncharacterized membrane protein YdjX (TVP38/TMEM64 family)